jgi:hypothetical protein
MSWRYEQRMELWPNGRVLPTCLLVGDGAVEIRMDFVKHWLLEYRGADLQARLAVSRDWRDVPPEKRGGGDDDHVLGPNCLVMLDRSRLSRPLSSDDLPALAANVKGALYVHWQIPWAPPPKIERVRFSNAELKLFDD